MDDDNSLISADDGELDRKLEPKYSTERQLPLQPPEEGPKNLSTYYDSYKDATRDLKRVAGECRLEGESESTTRWTGVRRIGEEPTVAKLVAYASLPPKAFF